ncbi:MAG: hypothetical protein ACPGYL_01265, partial [Rhodospirillaceae bacterium]
DALNTRSIMVAFESDKPISIAQMSRGLERIAELTDAGDAGRWDDVRNAGRLALTLGARGELDLVERKASLGEAVHYFEAALRRAPADGYVWFWRAQAMALETELAEIAKRNAQGDVRSLYALNPVDYFPPDARQEILQSLDMSALTMPYAPNLVFARAALWATLTDEAGWQQAHSRFARQIELAFRSDPAALAVLSGRLGRAEALEAVLQSRGVAPEDLEPHFGRRLVPKEDE